MQLTHTRGAGSTFERMTATTYGTRKLRTLVMSASSAIVTLFIAFACVGAAPLDKVEPQSDGAVGLSGVHANARALLQVLSASFKIKLKSFLDTLIL